MKRVPALEDIGELNDLHRRLVFAEFAQEHAAWFDEFRIFVSSAYGRGNPSVDRTF